VFLPDFCKQSLSLNLQGVLDWAADKKSETKEHKKFYVESLEPNQGKKPRPTLVGFSTLH